MKTELVHSGNLLIIPSDEHTTDSFGESNILGIYNDLWG